MSSHHTVIHLPVTFVTPPGTTPEDYARFMAAEAALMLEKFSNADDITVGEESIDPITPAYTDPAATSNAAAGWADGVTWCCPHHGELGGDTEHCRTCVETGVTSAPNGGAA